jgi:hypothetical protein
MPRSAIAYGTRDEVKRSALKSPVALIKPPTVSQAPSQSPPIAAATFGK